MKRKMMLMVPMLHQGGYERVCLTTARVLEPFCDVTVVIFDSADIAYDVSGLKIVDIGLGVKKRKLSKIINIIRRTLRVRKLKKELAPEVVYSFGPTANMVNAFSRTKTAKVWLGLRSYDDVRDKIKMRLFVKLADLMICCTRQMETELHDNYQFYQTTTLYNLFDIEAIQREAYAQEAILPWGDEAICLISMGRDAEVKGFWHMLKVFSLVHDHVPDARLVILGAGSFDECRELAAKLGIQNHVCFAGMQTAPYSYLRKAAVYLLTSRNEGFPNAIVEGMALGLAAVSVDCRTGPAEILLEKPPTEAERQKRYLEDKIIWGDYGVLLPVMDAEEDYDIHISEAEKNMAAAVLKLLDDRELLKKYQEAAALRAKDFTYEAYVNHLMSLFDAANVTVQ